jgi:hypothetical protein
MAQLDWDLGGGGSSSSGGSSGSDTSSVSWDDYTDDPRTNADNWDGDSDDGGSDDTTSWEDLGYGGIDNGGSSGESTSTTTDSGVDEVRNPDAQLRYESGLDDTSNATGSAVVTSGGAPDAGAVTVSPTRTTEDANAGGDEEESFLDTVDRLTDSVTRERNQDTRDDNDIPTGGPAPEGRGGESPLPIFVREGDGGLDPTVAVGLLVLAALVFGGG